MTTPNEQSSRELMPCPFCGSAAESGDGFLPAESIVRAWCSNSECYLHDNDVGFTPETWNARSALSGSAGSGEKKVVIRDGRVAAYRNLKQVPQHHGDCFGVTVVKRKDADDLIELFVEDDESWHFVTAFDVFWRPELLRVLEASISSTPSALPAQAVGEVTDAMRKAFDDRNNSLEADERDGIIAAILAIAAPMPQAEPTDERDMDALLTLLKKERMKTNGVIAEVESVRNFYFANNPANTGLAIGFNAILALLNSPAAIISAPQEASKVDDNGRCPHGVPTRLRCESCEQEAAEPVAWANPVMVQDTTCPNSAALRSRVLARIEDELRAGAGGFFIDNGFDDDIAAPTACESTTHHHVYGELTGAQSFIGLMSEVSVRAKRHDPHAIVLVNEGVLADARFYGLGLGDVSDGELWESYLFTTYVSRAHHATPWSEVYRRSVERERAQAQQQTYVMSYPWTRDEAFFAYATARLCALPFAAALGKEGAATVEPAFPELTRIRLGHVRDPRQVGGTRTGAVYQREYEDGVVLVNPDDNAHEITLPVPTGVRDWRELATGSQGKGAVIVALPAHSGRVVQWTR